MEYIEKAIEYLKQLNSFESENIMAAAKLLADTIESGKCIFSFGASHSFIMTEEMVYRTGGLMLVNPIYPHGMNLSVRPMTQTSQFERLEDIGKVLLDSSPIKDGDTLIITSTSGRNAVVIDMALRAKERNIKVIAITAISYSDGVSSRHKSGKKLLDLADIVIDNVAPKGDTIVELDGLPATIGPLSTVTGIAIVNSIVVETARLLIKRGITPPVYISANLDNGDSYNDKLLKENKDRIFYMD